MLDPDDGPGLRLPWEDDRPGSPPGWTGQGGIFGSTLFADLKAVPAMVREVKGALGKTGGASSPAGGPSASGRRGPDRLSEMPGGAEVVLRHRRARRKELVKEGLNVGAGVVGVFLVSGLALLGWGVGPEAAVASAAAAALGYGTVLGREVLADLAGVRDRERRDADWS